MFSGTGRTRGPESGTVTLIGPGVRIDGNIAFSGYLRVQGDIVGDIRCDSDASGTVVVHGAGSVTGSIATPNIIVGGRVRGPMHATGSIEIQDGAHVTGDARYKLLTIEPGAIVEGLMRSTDIPDEGAPRLDRRIVDPDSPEIQVLDGAVTHHRRASDRYRHKGRMTGIAAAVIVAIGVGAWLHLGGRVLPPDEAVAVAAPQADTSPPAPASLPASGPPSAPPAVPSPRLQATAPAIPEPPPPKAGKAKNENPLPVAGRIITVEGMDAGKPANTLFVKTREPVVLFVKSRNGMDDGTRLDVPSRATRRYPIAEGEMIRVAQGRDVDIYFQGRKLSSSMIEGGQWIAFKSVTSDQPVAAVKTVISPPLAATAAMPAAVAAGTPETAPRE